VWLKDLSFEELHLNGDFVMLEFLRNVCITKRTTKFTFWCCSVALKGHLAKIVPMCQMFR